jgi:hypothetical protein
MTEQVEIETKSLRHERVTYDFGSWEFRALAKLVATVMANHTDDFGYVRVEIDEDQAASITVTWCDADTDIHTPFVWYSMNVTDEQYSIRVERLDLKEAA